MFVIANIFLFVLFSLYESVSTERASYQGCFTHDPNNKLLTKSNSAVASLSVDQCVDACTHAYQMFAALSGARHCFCGSKYDTRGPAENCTLECSANRTQICGGIDSDSVYATGFMTPGPPTDLSNVSSTETSIQIRWNPPENLNGGVTFYKVTANLLYTYDTEEEMIRLQEWQFPNSTFIEVIGGLKPGSQYNVSVQALSAFGDGPQIFSTFWTEVGYPPNPLPPEIMKRDGSKSMTIKLPVIQLKTGPTSYYRVVVLDESEKTELNPLKLTDFNEARVQHLPYYIAAELSPSKATSPFVVGDGGTYNNYLNAPLDENKSYTVVVGIVSNLNGISRASYSKPAVHVTFFGATMSPDNTNSSFHNNNLRFPNRPQNDDPSHDAMVIGLSVAIGIGSFLLIASIIVFFMMKRYVKRATKPTDRQELTVHQMSQSDNSESGVISSVLDNETMDVAENLESIKTRLWMIPASNLEISDHVLGEGKFGPLRNGLAHCDGRQIPVIVHTSCDPSVLSNVESRTLVNQLEAMVRLGAHTNVVAVVGVSETPQQLHVAVEQYQSFLKDSLLESRALDHYPVFAEKHGKFCTLREENLLELGLGVAQGMNHLANNKIVHSRLCSWHVKIIDGNVPKVSHFGLAQYEDNAEIIEYSRWAAFESLKSNRQSSKSDVWSFGILLWEIVTLGATPYASVKSKDVATRVIRGMRLEQPKYIGDELYQLMLQCWQIDSDERPSFSVIVDTLRNMLVSNDADSRDLLCINIFPGFQYEKYDMEAEKISLRSRQV